jgi:hypothetical protein
MKEVIKGCWKEDGDARDSKEQGGMKKYRNKELHSL